MYVRVYATPEERQDHPIMRFINRAGFVRLTKKVFPTFLTIRLSFFRPGFFKILSPHSLVYWGGLVPKSIAPTVKGN